VLVSVRFAAPREETVTVQDMLARIAQLEAQLAARARRTPAERQARTDEKDRDKARKRQFRLDAQRRMRLGMSGVNRYCCYSAG
jgi:hypothetical protein